MLQRVSDPPADAARMKTARRALAEAIVRLAPEGQPHRPEALPALMLFRSGSKSGPVCGLYEPGVALIVQGRKEVLLGSDRIIYGPHDVLMSALNLPAVAQVLDASPEKPYLSLMLRMDPHEIARLMVDGHVPPARSQAQARAMGTGGLSWPLLNAFQRLVDLLDDPGSIPALAPLIQREIAYRLLMSEHGERLRQIGTAGTQSHQIGRAIDWLQTHFTEALRIDDLAAHARMSVSTFHHHFRSLTAMSPLQYQKWLRLNEARRLMLAERLDASTAAFRVGYESASQFSREYSRQFGAPPMRDIAGLRRDTQAEAPA
jgi:AraC-like DNA-binding protein